MKTTNRRNVVSGVARRLPDALFVYGTLRKECPGSTFSMIARGAELVEPARVQGRIYQLEKYPGLVLTSDPSTWVYGELYAFADLGRTLRRLDDFEGCGPRDPEPHQFRRVETRVVLRSGRRGRAWVYEFTGAVRGRELIASGDYVQFMRGLR